MKTKPKNKIDNIKVLLIVSLVLNSIFIIGVIVSTVIINTAGTNRYRYSILNTTENYIQDQYCSGKGYENLMKDSGSSISGKSASEIKVFQAAVSKQICGI